MISPEKRTSRIAQNKRGTMNSKDPLSLHDSTDEAVSLTAHTQVISRF